MMLFLHHFPARSRAEIVQSVSSTTKPIQSAMSVTGIIHTQSGL